ncbi:ankyrin repeat-containing domain protein [Bombardia bombarda]|uniref:Ankyrin repeat-containing domain protein n=1 Tax=Bombardia bombarda TaxID=252184 RepID=A0AA39X6U6_9PEZI|nr:ankyrin repeat-containing domain protein [Bombardia bombarda]
MSTDLPVDRHSSQDSTGVSGSSMMKDASSYMDLQATRADSMSNSLISPLSTVDDGNDHGFASGLLSSGHSSNLVSGDDEDYHFEFTRTHDFDHSSLHIDPELPSLNLMSQQDSHLHHETSKDNSDDGTQQITAPVTPISQTLVNTSSALMIIDSSQEKRSAPTTRPSSRRQSQGMTPLHLGSQSGHCGILNLLLQNGAEVDSQDEKGRTALHHAAQNGHREVADLLLSWGADPMMLDSEGLSVLHVAVAAGHEAVVRLLVEKGVDPNIRSTMMAKAYD